MSKKSSPGSEIVLDVREDLRSGREPFSKIMDAVKRVPPGGTMVLYATFKPTPLMVILGRQGFEYEATKMEGGDWSVVFRKNTEERGAVQEFNEEPPSPDNEIQLPADNMVIELDNRGLEPPEPMVRTLEAINTLHPGGRIVGQFDRRPMFLLPRLEQMGFTYEVTSHDDGSATVVVTRPDK